MWSGPHGQTEGDNLFLNGVSDVRDDLYHCEVHNGDGTAVFPIRVRTSQRLFEVAGPFTTQYILKLDKRFVVKDLTPDHDNMLRLELPPLPARADQSLRRALVEARIVLREAAFVDASDKTRIEYKPMEEEFPSEELRTFLRALGDDKLFHEGLVLMIRLSTPMKIILSTAANVQLFSFERQPPVRCCVWFWFFGFGFWFWFWFWFFVFGFWFGILFSFWFWIWIWFWNWICFWFWICFWICFGSFSFPGRLLFHCFLVVS